MPDCLRGFFAVLESPRTYHRGRLAESVTKAVTRIKDVLGASVQIIDIVCGSDIIEFQVFATSIVENSGKCLL